MTINGTIYVRAYRKRMTCLCEISGSNIRPFSSGGLVTEMAFPELLPLRHFGIGISYVALPYGCTAPVNISDSILARIDNDSSNIPLVHL